MNNYYDLIVIGGGIYGLYAAWKSKKKKVLLLEQDNDLFKRATYINQARVHMGYHYPRSLSTAKKSANYFDRFVDDFGFCINQEFEQIYATSTQFSWTNAKQFEQFSQVAGIPCERVSVDSYFNEGVCDGAFLTKEYTYDATILKNYLLKEVNARNVEIKCNSQVYNAYKEGDLYCVKTAQDTYYTSFLFNATYASTNQITEKLGFEGFKLKYELCEIILTKPCDRLRNKGITVMDGPFFSIMPFGKTGYHSLTSVSFTPHMTSYNDTPKFQCQNKNNECSSDNLKNCNNCLNKPKSSWTYMSSLAHKYLKSEYEFTYEKSLYSMKPILVESEIDDSRPTVIRKFSENPTYIAVLSGKINTVYDLDEVLN